MPKNLLNALLFSIGWFACVAGGGLGLWLVAVIMLVHLLYVGSWRREGKLLVSVFLFGSAVDSFLLQFGVFDFGEPRQLIPLWLALTWLLLGSTLCHCLACHGGAPACWAPAARRCITTRAPDSMP